MGAAGRGIGACPTSTTQIRSKRYPATRLAMWSTGTCSPAPGGCPWHSCRRRWLLPITIPVFLNQSGRGAQAAVKSDLRNAATAAEAYWTMTGTPPVDAQVLDDYGWLPAAGVTLTLVSSSPAGYCLEGAHVDLPGSTWHYDSPGGLGEGP